MKTIRLLIASLLFIFSFTTTFAQPGPPEVQLKGSMKNVMREGNLKAHISLDTLEKSNLFGLGPVAGLQGELMVLNGKVFQTSRNGNQLLNRKDSSAKAAFFVFSYVKEWKIIEAKAQIDNLAELEKWIEATAVAQGMDLEAPFVFQIETTVVSAPFHIIHWEEGTEHSFDNHKQFAYHGEWKAKPVTLLGFYSRHHKSLFTHHSSNLHIHVLEEQSATVGHLDDIWINGELKISFGKKRT
jgi:acetolactate decarboxylase